MNQAMLDAYLERLGLAKTDVGGAGRLSALVRAHLEQIPFEDLDVYDFHQIPDLSEEALFEKIVRGRRGGYCFELNRLFLALLEASGYDAYAVAVRVMWNRSQLPPTTHMGIIVREEGKKYYCDVGYGGPGPKGLLALAVGEQAVQGERFRVTKSADADLRIEKKHHEEWKAVLQFEDHPFRLVDFEPINYYCAGNPNVLFTQKRVLYLYTPRGSKSLLGMELTVSEDGESRRTTYRDREELERGLLEEFGIAVSLPDPEAGRKAGCGGAGKDCGR